MFRKCSQYIVAASTLVVRHWLTVRNMDTQTEQHAVVLEAMNRCYDEHIMKEVARMLQPGMWAMNRSQVCSLSFFQITV
jgi:hypothetical protein